MKRIANKLLSTNSLFVGVNIFVSLIGFFRSFVFMDVLDMAELGIVSIVQTIMIFLGVFQIGLINGGYRIFSLNKPENQKNVNNLVFSYIALLFCAIMILYLILIVTNTSIVISNDIMFGALICGLLYLSYNWLTNTLIGKRRIKEISLIHTISALISLACFPLVWLWGVWGGVLNLGIHSIAFITTTFILFKELRPTKWCFDIKLLRYILSFGFLPFLSVVSIIFVLQIERWSIAEILGVEALGMFYLVFLFSIVYNLVPTSILNLCFPRVVYSYESGQRNEFLRILKIHLSFIVAYIAITTVMTITCLQPVIDMILPKQSANTEYVFYFLPGAIAVVLCHSFTLISAATVRLKPYIFTGIGSIVFMLGFVILAPKYDAFTLKNMAIAKSCIECSILIIYAVYVLRNRRSIFIELSPSSSSSKLDAIKM